MIEYSIRVLSECGMGYFSHPPGNRTIGIGLSIHNSKPYICSFSLDTARLALVTLT